MCFKIYSGTRYVICNEKCLRREYLFDKLTFVQKQNRSAWAQYTIQIDDRDHVHESLVADGIPSAVHYPTVLFSQPVFQQAISYCPHSVSFASKVMSLPMHPYLEAEAQSIVVEHLKKALY